MSRLISLRRLLAGVSIGALILGVWQRQRSDVRRTIKAAGDPAGMVTAQDSAPARASEHD